MSILNKSDLKFRIQSIWRIQIISSNLNIFYTKHSKSDLINGVYNLFNKDPYLYNELLKSNDIKTIVNILIDDCHILTSPFDKKARYTWISRDGNIYIKFYTASGILICTLLFEKLFQN